MMWLTLLLGTAQAADLSVGLDTGRVYGDSPALDQINAWNTGWRTSQLHVTASPGGALALVGAVGWRHQALRVYGGPGIVSEGTTVWEDDGYDGYYDSDLRGGVTTLDAAIGGRFAPQVTPWLRPYAQGELMLRAGVLSLDEDVSTRDNLNQYRHVALAPGGRAALGSEFDLVPTWGVSPMVYLEGGYAWSSAMDFDALGALQLKGFTFRTGMGVRF